MLNKYLVSQPEINATLKIWIGDTGFSIKLLKRFYKEDNKKDARQFIVNICHSIGYRIALNFPTFKVYLRILSYYGSTVISIEQFKADIRNGAFNDIINRIEEQNVTYYGSIKHSEIHRYALKRLDDTHFEVYNYNYATKSNGDYIYVKSAFNIMNANNIRDWFKEYYCRYNIERIQSKPMGRMSQLVVRMIKHYGEHTVIDINDLMRDAKENKIILADTEQKSIEVGASKYILMIEPFNQYNKYVTYFIHLKTTLDFNNISKWYARYKNEIYEMLKNKAGRGRAALGDNLNCYELCSARLGKGNILSLTFKLKEGLLEMEKQIRKEKEEKRENKHRKV